MYISTRIIDLNSLLCKVTDINWRILSKKGVYCFLAQFSFFFSFARLIWDGILTEFISLVTYNLRISLIETLLLVTKSGPSRIFRKSRTLKLLNGTVLHSNQQLPTWQFVRLFGKLKWLMIHDQSFAPEAPECHRQPTFAFEQLEKHFFHNEQA